MASFRLEARRVAKPWGRRDLEPWAAPVAVHDAPVGEIVFASPDGAPLLIKLLFTAAPLSVQVHPQDDYAMARGLPHGKDEAWLILSAAVGASIGLGPKTAISVDDLAASIADGSIAGRLARKAVAPGDLLFAPAGTIHTIGAGLALLEVQQNLDLTYRLHDYGRPRDLHIEDGVAVAHREPWTPPSPPQPLGVGRMLLHDGPSFTIERVHAGSCMALQPAPGRPVWAAVVAGRGAIDGAEFAAGDVWLCDSASNWQIDGDADVVLAYPGQGPVDRLIAA